MNNDFGADDDDDLTDSSPLSTVGGVDSIKVSVRIRPLIRDDRDIGEVLAWRWDQQTITHYWIRSWRSLPEFKIPGRFPWSRRGNG